MHPQEFLLDLFRLQPRIVEMKIQHPAEDRDRSLTAMLRVLSASVPKFAAKFSESLVDG